MTEQTFYRWINATGAFGQRYLFEIVLGLAVFVVYCAAEVFRWPWDERVEHHDPPSRCNGGGRISGNRFDNGEVV